MPTSFRWPSALANRGVGPVQLGLSEEGTGSAGNKPRDQTAGLHALGQTPRLLCWTCPTSGLQLASNEWPVQADVF